MPHHRRHARSPSPRSVDTETDYDFSARATPARRRHHRGCWKGGDGCCAIVDILGIIALVSYLPVAIALLAGTGGFAAVAAPGALVFVLAAIIILVWISVSCFWGLARCMGILSVIGVVSLALVSGIAGGLFSALKVKH